MQFDRSPQIYIISFLVNCIVTTMVQCTYGVIVSIHANWSSKSSPFLIEILTRLVINFYLWTCSDIWCVETWSLLFTRLMTLRNSHIYVGLYCAPLFMIIIKLIASIYYPHRSMDLLKMSWGKRLLHSLGSGMTACIMLMVMWVESQILQMLRCCGKEVNLLISHGTT